MLPVDKVGDVSSYAAVVLGSAVYAGQWRGEAVKLLEPNEQLLANRAVWFFSSGPTGEGDPSALMKGFRFPEAQRPSAGRIKPRDIAFFHGSIDMKKLNMSEKLLAKVIKAPAGAFRDWNAIGAWANGIAGALK